jgi:hypothetical protein
MFLLVFKLMFSHTSGDSKAFTAAWKFHRFNLISCCSLHMARAALLVGDCWRKKNFFWGVATQNFE